MNKVGKLYPLGWISWVCTIGLLVIAATPSPADAEKLRVVVMDFSGGDEIAAVVRDLVNDVHRLVPAQDYRVAARDLRAASYDAKDVRRTCKKIGCDAVIRGILEEESRRAYVLELLIYSGATGSKVERVALRLQKPEISRRLERPLKNRLLDALKVAKRGRNSGHDGDFRDDRRRDDRRRSSRDLRSSRDDDDREFSDDDREFSDDDEGDIGGSSEMPASRFGVHSGIMSDVSIAVFGGLQYGLHAISAVPELRIEPAVSVFVGFASNGVTSQTFYGARLLAHTKYMFTIKNGPWQVFPVGGLEIAHFRVGSASSTEVGVNLGGGFQYNSFGAQATLGIGRIYDYVVTGLYYF